MQDPNLTPSTEGTEPIVTPAEVTPAPAPQEPVAPPQEPAQVPPAQPDYKDKFAQSAANAQILAGRAKALEEQLTKLTSQEPVTDAELKAEYSAWDSFNVVEKDVFSRLLSEKKARMRTENLVLQTIAEQKFAADKEALFSQEQYQTLRNDPDFDKFVLSPKNKNVSIETLADSYLFKKGVKEPVIPAVPASAPREDGLPRGSGGPRTTETPGISGEEITALAQSDPKRFRQMLKEGQIKL